LDIGVGGRGVGLILSPLAIYLETFQARNLPFCKSAAFGSMVMETSAVFDP